MNKSDKKVPQDKHRTLVVNAIDEIVSLKAGDVVEAVPIGPDGNKMSTISADKIHLGLSKSYSGYFDILEDLNRATKCLTLLLSIDIEKDNEIANALFVDGILSYARCFVEAEDRGAGLHKSKPWIEIGTVEEMRHNQIMEMRHAIYAHSGKSNFRKITT